MAAALGSYTPESGRTRIIADAKMLADQTQMGDSLALARVGGGGGEFGLALASARRRIRPAFNRYAPIKRNAAAALYAVARRVSRSR